jgi:type II secretory pathway pseudopilin PulG
MKHARRAITMLELFAAMVIAAVLLAAVAQVAVLSAAQHLAAERRMLALSEAEQIVEQISALPLAEVSRENLQAIQLSPDVAQALPEAALSIDLSDDAGPPLAKRIRIEITWEAQPDVSARPVRLTTWRFAGGQP